MMESFDQQKKWDSVELRRLVDEGIFIKCQEKTEHMALHPFWLSNPLQGIEEDLEQSLGKWKKKLGGYLVCYKNVRKDQKISPLMNADTPWVHVDYKAKLYIYKPQIGQKLRGTVKRVGEKAAVCVFFNFFSVSVKPRHDSKFDTWTYGTELEFTVTSTFHRGKGPEIRAICNRVLNVI